MSNGITVNQQGTLFYYKTIKNYYKKTLEFLLTCMCVGGGEGCLVKNLKG